MLGELLRLSFDLGPRLNERLGRIVADDIRGAILEFDPYWLQIFFWQWVDHPWFTFSTPHLDREYTRLRHRLRDRKDIERMLEYRPPQWDAYCDKLGYPQGASPIIIRMILRHPADKSFQSREMPNQFEQYPIVYEYRSRCRALSSGMIEDLLQRLGFGSLDGHAPISVGQANPNTAGTLGGVLRGAQTGEYYLVSCAHVLGGVGTQTLAPGPFEGHQSRQIGVVEYSEIAPLKKPSQPCNPRSCPDAAQLDAAIARVTIGVTGLQTIGELPTISNVRFVDDMQQNDDVFFVGKVSKRVDAQLEGVVMWFELEYEDGPRCFGGGFSLKPRPPRYIYDRLAQPGDSGAWVMAQNGSGLCWTGMLIGGDDTHAYACFAETILKAFSDKIPGGLTLP